MNIDVETETRFRALHPDDTLLELNPEEEAFFKLETGIQNTEELRKHIIKVQEDAYKVSRCSRADQIESALRAVTLSCVPCSDLPVFMHSWVQVYEAQDRRDACVSTRPRIGEESAGCDLSGDWVLL